MHTKIKTILIAGSTLLSLTLTGFSASAKNRGDHAFQITPDTYGRGNYDAGYRGRGYRPGGHGHDYDYDHDYDSGYGYDYGYGSRRDRGHSDTYRTTCRPIHTCFSVRGYHRYKTTTYLHTKTDCHGHIVASWRTEETVCIGSCRY